MNYKFKLIGKKAGPCNSHLLVEILRTTPPTLSSGTKGSGENVSLIISLNAIQGHLQRKEREGGIY